MLASAKPFDGAGEFGVCMDVSIHGGKSDERSDCEEGQQQGVR